MICPNGKKTNSLAFARSDCHTCAAAGQVCDRRRPRCATCLQQDRQCGGFATPLSWDDSRMWLGKPARNRNATAVDTGSYPARGLKPVDEAHPRPVRFVTASAGTRKRRRPNGVSSKSKAVHPAHTQEHTDELSIHLAGQSTHLYDRHMLDSYLEDDPMLFDLFQSEVTQLGSQDYIEVQEPSSNMDSGPSGTLDYPEMASQIFGDTLSTPHPCPTPAMSSYEGPTTSSLQKPILSLMADQHQELLRLYDTEFCVLPITSDTSLNPFRYSQETSNGSRLLFHAILAICCQHLNRITGNWATEAEEHRVQAANLLNDALQQEQLARMGLALLDPILVIFTLDCTLSAAGPWVKHLNQIRSIIEFCGGPCALDKPRIRSQVGMFLWWDATLALISRQGTVLSRDYLDHLACSERHDGWSFYDLTGCPSDLFIILFHLAELAKQNEIACNMTWLTFDPTPVKQVEHQIHNWDSDAFAEPCCSRPSNVYNSSESDSGTDDVTMEEAMHAQQDRYHRAEAWRHALLIYIERVLKWDRKSPRPKSLNKLIRSVLNHVRCCRRTCLTQKQLLLPVFLAGSETRNEEMRDLAISYCKWWGSRSRYSMFDSVSDLLKEVWAEDTPNSPRTYWWGTVVDRKTTSTKPGQIPTQFLFG